ncbi:hypothetical protein FB45DRAFT_1096133 [Roridomyces roridus]|uniref:Uncharacterized protein n=1 Tax=Roridomyces roridus TaxID=1738132 RepID=A0AAD7BFT0_9AGAR|nr:hypothetical protein FB45DRAFT_1096133 [Roridomyces roridus]
MFRTSVVFSLCLLQFQAYAGPTNLTVDDTDATHWTFVGSWHAITPAARCPATLCSLQPDPDQVYNSTWHDGGLRSGSFSFQGTAVYIYGIDVPASNAANVTFSTQSTVDVEAQMHKLGRLVPPPAYS